MRIRLKKKWREFAVGTVLEVADPRAKELICEGTAERYDDEYPPKEKMKTEFFKPKKQVIRNGKG